MIQVGDIIEFDCSQFIASSPPQFGVVKHYGYVEHVCSETDKARIGWFEAKSTEFCGQYISTWSYGLMWRKVR